MGSGEWISNRSELRTANREPLPGRGCIPALPSAAGCRIKGGNPGFRMDERFPLPYQIGFILLTALFAVAFSISREPRQWRRFWQARVARVEEVSVNRNKYLDEQLKHYSILIAMAFLVLDVGVIVAGLTHKYRNTPSTLTEEQRLRVAEQRRLGGQ